MKAIMVMFDSLNRHMLSPYADSWVHAPNFARLAERTVTFDRSYVCSMPCMPARRDFHTGRPNFLHRSWSPLEPFDDSVPRILSENGIYTHLASDHYHYWEDAGMMYNTKYDTWEFFRGQEGDPWKGQVADPDIPDDILGRTDKARMWRQDWVNRRFMDSEERQPQPQTFAAGLDFMRRNCDQDSWFLQIETFDPHEPFYTQQKYKDLYQEHYQNYRGPHLDWPPYRGIQEPEVVVDHARHEYAALVSMCDAQLGKVLALMDKLSLWDDTMLIVWTDHGFLLGEHACWAKIWMPFYEEVSHTPFWIWDPRCGKRSERRGSLVQPSIDIGPTLLEFFGLSPTPDMLGHDLAGPVAEDRAVRDAALFGLFGQQVNVTDGRYVYMRAPATQDNQPLDEYTLVPFQAGPTTWGQSSHDMEVVEPLPFTKGKRVLRMHQVMSARQFHPECYENRLYDLESDPGQSSPLEDAAVESKMIDHLVRLMKEADAPAEQFVRLGLAT